MLRQKDVGGVECAGHVAGFLQSFEDPAVGKPCGLDRFGSPFGALAGGVQLVKRDHADGGVVL